MARIWCWKRPRRRRRVIDLLSRHKADVVALLRTWRDGWSGEDWQAFFDERAGIAEFDGGLPRDQAEARAFACCVAEWLNRNPVRSPPGRCLAAARRARPRSAAAVRRRDRPAMPGCILSCWSAWSAARHAEARRVASSGNGDRAPDRVSKRFREKRRRMMGGFGSGRPSGSGAQRWKPAVRSTRTGCIARAACARLDQAAGNGRATAKRSPRSICAPSTTGCISPIACASAAAIGRTSTRPSASSACPAASAERGPISSVPAS